LLAGFLGLAAVTFILLSLSDYIDGYIARKYHQVSELGKLLDPLADKILVTTVLIGLTAIGKANPFAVMLICAREFIIASIRTRKIFAASPIAKWKTATQILAIVMLMFSLPFAEAVLWLAVILSLVSGGAYLWQSPFLKQLRLS
jgi:CDP-diacylglycerol--glycerol-3-phosphate 3-phosphatidyltransferase